MSGQDLVQLRWQQIRSAECMVSLEKENVELKKQIASLKMKLLTTQNSGVGVKKEILDKITMHLQSYAMKDKSELSKIKQALSDFGEERSVWAVTLERALSQFQHLSKLQDHEIRRLKNDVGNNSSEADMLRRELAEKASLVEMERQRLREAKTQFDIELQRCEGIIGTCETTISELNKRNEEAEKYRHSLKKTMHELEKGNAQLREQLILLEKKSNDELSEVLESKNRMSQNYEQMIDDMSIDNQRMRDRISELEEQVMLISKLSSALVGNKSHFAKYVEVKTENLALQSKLDVLKGRHPKLREKHFSVDTESDQLRLPQIASNFQSKKHSEKHKERVLV